MDNLWPLPPRGHREATTPQRCWNRGGTRRWNLSFFSSSSFFSKRRNAQVNFSPTSLPFSSIHSPSKFDASFSLSPLPFSTHFPFLHETVFRKNFVKQRILRFANETIRLKTFRRKEISLPVSRCSERCLHERFVRPILHESNAAYPFLRDFSSNGCTLDGRVDNSQGILRACLRDACDETEKTIYI